MRRLRYLFVVLGILVVIGVLVGLKASQIGTLMAFGEEAKAAGPPPETVGTATATKDRWERTLDAVGSITSTKGVTVTTEVPGKVTRIRFDSGEVVDTGEVLIELDSRIERAELASLLARKELLATNLGRSRILERKGVIPPAELDADESALETIEADIGALRAQISKKTIRAPFAGRLGIRQVNLGQYVNPGDPITVLEAVDGVYVDFTLPQEKLDVLELGMPVRVREGQAIANERRPDAVTYEGTIAAIDPTVDPETRQIPVRATLADGAGSLRPGMFVDVEVVLPEKNELVAVPATAIVHAPYGDSVFVVEEKPADTPGMRQTARGDIIQVARQKFVRTGRRRGDYVAIETGVEAGEEVVTSGAFKLKNGAPIVISEEVVLAPKLEPRPANR